MKFLDRAGFTKAREDAMVQAMATIEAMRTIDAARAENKIVLPDAKEVASYGH